MSSPTTPSYPERRFVQLRLPRPRPNLHTTVTFTAAASERSSAPAPPHPVAHAAIDRLTAASPARAAAVAERLETLRRREPEIMTWLERSPAHTALFFQDPAAALHAALPDLPADFFACWRG